MSEKKNIRFLSSEFLWLIGILLLGALLRLIVVSSIPNGLYQDETAIGYNAYSILKTGFDEHHQFLPLYFKSFGDYKLPLYIYLTAGSMFLFGLNEFAVRFPSILFGILAILGIYLLTKELTKNTRLSLISSFMLAINPWHMHFSRAAFEVNVAVTLLLFGVVFFMRAMRQKGSPLLLLSALVCFILSLYTYNVTRLLAPLTGLLLFTYYWPEVKTIPKKYLVQVLGVGLLLLLPFLTTLFGHAGVASAKEGLLLSSDTQAQILQERSYFIYSPKIVQMLFFNKYIQTVFVYLQHIVGIFSPSFFFISGSSHGNHGIGLGMFYIFEALTIVLGFLLAYKVDKNLRLVYLWLGAMILVLALSKEVPHGTRGFALVIPLTIFSAIGLSTFLQKVLTLKNFPLRLGIGLVSVAVIAFSISHYMLFYFTVFPKTYAKSWNAQDKQVAQLLNQEQKNIEHVYIDTDSNLIYTSLLFYQAYPPAQFHKTAVYSPDTVLGYSLVNSFGKYSYQKITGENIKNLDKTIVVTAKDFGSQYLQQVFYYPAVPVVFASDGVIHTIEKKEVAYRVYSAVQIHTTMSTP